MTTTTVSTATFSTDTVSTTAARVSGRSTAPTVNPGLGAITYRPGTGPDTDGLVFYAVISVRGQLTIVAATAADTSLYALHQRSSSGVVRRSPLGEGITAWATTDMPLANPAATEVATRLIDSWFRGYDVEVAGPVVFTGTGSDGAGPIGLTPAQVLLLRALHARSADTISD